MAGDMDFIEANGLAIHMTETSLYRCELRYIGIKVPKIRRIPENRRLVSLKIRQLDEKRVEWLSEYEYRCYILQELRKR